MNQALKDTLTKSDNGVAYGLVIPQYNGYGNSKFGEETKRIGMGEKIFSHIEACYKELGKPLDFAKFYVNLTRFGNSSGKSAIDDNVKRKELYVLHQIFVDKDRHQRIKDRIGPNLKRKGSSKTYLIDPLIDALRQHRLDTNESHDARDYANACENSYYDRVFATDVHFSEAPSVFSARCPLEVINLNAAHAKALLQYFGAALKDFTICAADFGALPLGSGLAEILGLPLFALQKSRVGTDKTKIVGYVGDPNLIKGKKVLLRDDTCGTGGTAINDRDYLIDELHAEEVIFVVSHLDCCKGAGRAAERKALETIHKGGLKTFTTNTVPHDVTQYQDVIKVTDVSDLLAGNILCHANNCSLTDFRRALKDEATALRNETYAKAM